VRFYNIDREKAKLFATDRLINMKPRISRIYAELNNKNYKKRVFGFNEFILQSWLDVIG
jgi:hypothetical protein